jgi:hypothetical protein
MANRFTTHVAIRGNAADLNAFKVRHIVDGEPEEGQQFDFNTVIPRPAVLEGTLAASPKPEAHPQNLKALAETGFPDWYEWSIANWSTKWNSETLYIIKDEGNELVFVFRTAFR